MNSTLFPARNAEIEAMRGLTSTTMLSCNLTRSTESVEWINERDAKSLRLLIQS